MPGHFWGGQRIHFEDDSSELSRNVFTQLCTAACNLGQVAVVRSSKMSGQSRVVQSVPPSDLGITAILGKL